MKTLLNNKGNSLAEFAVVIALMATLAATGQVKFSQAGEGGKGKKSANEIEKLSTFYDEGISGVILGKALYEGNICLKKVIETLNRKFDTKC